MGLIPRGLYGLARQFVSGKAQSMMNTASSVLTERRMQKENDAQNALAAAKTRMTYDRSFYKFASSLADEFNRMV